MAKMTIEEAFKKFRFKLAEKDGVAGFRVISGRPTKAQIERLRELKPEIMEEIKKRNAEEIARKNAEKVAQEKELQDIKAGQKKITLDYHDGEYLSGYTLAGQPARLLEELGIAKYVSGWGTLVEDKTVEMLGKEFTYQQALEYIRPVQEAKAAREAKARAGLEAKFKEAKITGKPVIIKTYIVPCSDPDEECNYDNIVEYAMPDGSIKREQHHTW